LFGILDRRRLRPQRGGSLYRSFLARIARWSTACLFGSAMLLAAVFSVVDRSSRTHASRKANDREQQSWNSANDHVRGVLSMISMRRFSAAFGSDGIFGSRSA
jgi:hypothetical protein